MSETENNTPRLCRSDQPHFKGKCTEDLKAHVPEEMKEDFIAVAAMSGAHKHGIYHKELLTAHVYGQISVIKNRMNIPDFQSGSLGSKHIDPLQIDATRDLCDALTVMGFITGTSIEEYILNVLAEHVYGKLHVLKNRTIQPEVKSENRD